MLKPVSAPKLNVKTISKPKDGSACVGETSRRAEIKALANSLQALAYDLALTEHESVIANMLETVYRLEKIAER